ncbi:hypothetical protein V2I01_30290 [Micromonospora sp. BRA006-A]|nr:hypothetical protein [Micromonospora sp. BRA006-A]
MVVASAAAASSTPRSPPGSTSTACGCAFDGPQDDKLVLRVDETIRDLMRAQDVPFAETADDPAAGLSGEVVASLPTFVFQDNVVVPLELPGCRAEEVVDPYAREVPNGLTVEVLPASTMLSCASPSAPTTCRTASPRS